MEKISFIITNYNTLDYSKWCYNSIRKNLNNIHEIVLLDDGSTDGETWNWMQEVSKRDSKVKIHRNSENTGIAYSYNKAVGLATNDIICLLHSDMYVPSKFDEIMLKYLKNYDFVTSWRVEPAIYPPSKDKVQVEFGRKLSEFDEDGFLTWTKNNEIDNKDECWARMCFPWMTTKKLFQDLGGIDILFLKYMVDDDDFYLRVSMTGAKITQTFETAVYHMCSRTTKYKDDIINDAGSDDWNSQHYKSTRNFVRKWGTHQSAVYKETEKGIEMVAPKKYDIGFVVENCHDINLLRFLEPWCSTIYIDDRKIILDYVQEEHHQTLYDLNDRVRSTSVDRKNDILIEFDALYLNEDRIAFLHRLSDILTDSGGVGDMKHDIFSLHIKSLNTYEEENIKCKNMEM